MELDQLLKSIGTKVEATEVREVVRDTLRVPSASPSDVVEALAVTLNPSGTRVIVDSAGTVDSGAAGKVMSYLVERGEIRIEGRRVHATEKLVQE